MRCSLFSEDEFGEDHPSASPAKYELGCHAVCRACVCGAADMLCVYRQGMCGHVPGGVFVCVEGCEHRHRALVHGRAGECTGQGFLCMHSSTVCTHMGTRRTCVWEHM